MHGTQRRRFHTLGWLGLGGSLLLLGPLLATSVNAQSADPYELSRQVSELQRDLTRLQQYVYSSSPSSGQAGSGGPLDLNPDYRERVEVRLTDLENQLRDLTGRVEEVTFAVRRVEERLDKLGADVDFRMTALERRGAGEASPAAPAAAGAGSQSGSTEAPAEGGRTQQTQSQLPAGSAAEEYQKAQRLLAQSRYDDAEATLRRFVEQHPQDQLADNARYWLGETYYVRKRYEEAASAFLEAYKQNPGGGKAPDNLLKLGLSLAALKKDKEACVAVNKLLREHPDSPDHIRRRAEQEKQALNCA